MEDIDFTVCPFIEEILCFLTYYDFCKNAKLLKVYYNALETNAKRFYKWYCYANIHIDEYHKNLIWEYLNSPEEEAYINLIEGINTYKVR